MAEPNGRVRVRIAESDSDPSMTDRQANGGDQVQESGKFGGESTAKENSSPKRTHDPKVIEMRLIRDKSNMDMADPSPLLSPLSADGVKGSLAMMSHNNSSSIMLGGNSQSTLTACCTPRGKTTLKHGIT
jgi:hypothetical protein